MSSIFRKLAVSACLAVGYPMMAAPPRCLPSSPEAAGSALCEALEPSIYALNRAGGRRDFWSRRTVPVPASPGAVAKLPLEAAIPTNPDATVGVGGVVRTTVLVEARPSATDSTEGFEHRITPQEIESSAGTFGDPSRFLQTLPGVVSDNDQRNDFLVRGGNPDENRFVIDNIEVPSINQLALSDTTGGFVSMIDTNAIQQMTLHTDAYDSRFDERLSSVVEISTRPQGKVERHSVAEFGLAGLGGSVIQPLGDTGSLLVSARQSVQQYMTGDIGLNGVPVYRNFLVRGENRVSDRDSWWGVSLTGIDSIKIRPNPQDAWETNPFDIDYSGWRNTTGVNWQHVYSRKAFGVLSLANSQQSQNVLDMNQLEQNAVVYNERTSDGITTLKYDWTLEAVKGLRLTAGGREAVDRMDYRVDQPIGLQNPYSESPEPNNAATLDRRLATTSTAAYGQASLFLPRRVKVVAGERLMQWSLGGSVVSTPKVLVAAPVLGRLVHAGFAEYAQLAPSLYLLSFGNDRTMKPIRARQFTGGIDVLDRRLARINVEAYEKRYSDYPVALHYPQLSLANIADTFGQAFLLFPMTSAGRGVARGVELSLETRPTKSLTFTAAASYSRSWYSGLDGVLRRGNLDLPVVVNLAGQWRLPHGMAMSFRYSGASGRPYTPDNMALSLAQNRDVYDLTQINAIRAAAYSRLDFRFERTSMIGRGTLKWHVGLQNALGTSNFYTDQWRPRADQGGTLGQTQLPRFPEGGMKYSF
jgi:hypothetical protein